MKTERRTVHVNEYKIGDMIHGKTITGFGKSWTEKSFDSDGQLWEECERCGTEPIYMPKMLCENCYPKTKTIELCYAYFELKEEN